MSLDLRLYLRRRIPLLQRAIAGVVDALARAGGRAGDALMPAFTHFRPAQPVLVAHFFLSHVAAAPARSRAPGGARDEADALPLGSGAIAGTGYAIDVDALARDLGFSRVVANSMDASSDRDFAATFLYAVRDDDGASQPAGGGSRSSCAATSIGSSSCPTRSAPAAA